MYRRLLLLIYVEDDTFTITHFLSPLPCFIFIYRIDIILYMLLFDCFFNLPLECLFYEMRASFLFTVYALCM